MNDRLGAGPLGPRWAAGGPAEPIVAAGLVACIGGVAAFDLVDPGVDRAGNPTAIVALVTVVAGWTLGTGWAALVWVLAAGACALGTATGDVPPLNAVAIAAAALAAGIGTSLGSRAFRASLVVLDQQAGLLRRAAALVSGASTLQAVLDEVLGATVRVLASPSGGRAASAAVLAAGDGGFELVTALGARPDVAPATLAEALRSERPVTAGPDGRTILCRVDAGATPWGVLVATRPAGARLGPRELALVEVIADLAGVAVDARLRSVDLERLRDRLQVTLDLAVEIGSSLDPVDVATSILRRAGEAVGADRATLARVQGDETELVAVHDRDGGAPLGWTGDRFPTGLLLAQEPVREAMRRLTPVLGGELAPDAASERYRDEVGGVRAVLAMPLVGRGALVGVLVLSRRRDVPFGEDDLATIQQFASVAVLALRNAWAHAELERGRASLDETARQLRLAVETAQDVGFVTELDQVTRRLLARSAAAVGADRGSIGRIVDDDQLVVEAVWPDAGEPRQAARMMSLAGVPGLLDRLRTGEPVQRSTGEGHHLLQHPLLAGGELVGVMALSREGDREFDEAELHGLQQLTSVAALILRSARLLAEARSLGEAKVEFLNMAAHELRTPLAVVRGYLSMMADGTLDVPERTRRQVVTVLCQKTDELSAMVETILTAAKIQAGGVQLRREVFDVGDSIRGAVERARARAEQAGVELWCQALPEPVRVEAVRGSVDRILDSLIGNAIAFGGGMPVRVTVEESAAVLVRVEDQGIGLAPHQQARLFEPFFRVDQPSVKIQAGAGLGLAVSRRLAELSGGSLDLEWTEPGSGSTFVLRLPSATGPAERASGVPPVG